MSGPLLYGTLALLRPLWLLALVPLALLLLWRARHPAAQGWAGVIDPALWPVLQKLRLFQHGTADQSRHLPFLAAFVLILALTGPASQRLSGVEYAALDPVILAMDLSPSVVADERVLTEAKIAAAGLVAGAAGRPVGVMLYAADAYLAVAPSSDPQAPLEVLASLDAQTMPLTGSRPEIALSMARDFFGGAATDQDGATGADLILITDGGGAGLRANEEASRLASDGYRIWGLQLSATAEGAPPVDAAALQALVAAGGGQVQPAADGATDLMQQVGAARRLRLAARDAGGAGWQDHGPWLLLAVLMLLLPSFRRRS